MLIIIIIIILIIILPLPLTVINSGAEPSLEEVERAIISLCNSVPGENGLSALLLKNAGVAVNKCLQYHHFRGRLGNAPWMEKRFNQTSPPSRGVQK